MTRGMLIALVGLALGCAQGGARHQSSDSPDPSTPELDGGVPGLVDSGAGGFDSGPPTSGSGDPRDAGLPGRGEDAGNDLDSGVSEAGSGAIEVDAGSGGCAESPCSLIAPQCGCPTGEACYLSDDTIRRVCEPAGTQAEGEVCAGAGSCAAGLDCVAFGSLQWCHRFCTTDADCEGSGSRCILDIEEDDGRISSFCTRSCDPVDQVGCPPGGACSVFVETTSGEGLTHCQEAGVGSQYSWCLDDSDCGAGYACVDGWCSQWCTSDSDCSIGFCYPFETSIAVDGIEYGYCF